MPTPGPLELVIILVIALIILGPGKLPDVGASLGKSIREFRKASSDIQEAATVKIDTSPLPPQQATAAPAATTPAATAAASQPPVATAAPYTQPAPPDVPAAAPSAASRIEELERELAERRAELARSGEEVGAASGSRESGTDAS